MGSRVAQKAHQLWLRVHQPRVISALYFAIYLCLLGGGIAAIMEPPGSIQGEVGAVAMYTLAGLLAFGGLVGSVAALPGIWWLERTAVLSIGLSAGIYGFIITALHFTEGGNRLLQLSFVMTVGFMQAVRWHRIRERPYDPDRAPAAPTH